MESRYLIFVALLTSSLVTSNGYAANAGDRLYRAVPPEIEKLTNPYRHDTQKVKVEGKKLYRKNCMFCHGAHGNGRGPISATQDPGPTSFLDKEYISQHSDQHLFWVVREGSQGTAMPGFKEKLTDDEIWLIVSYLRHLPFKYTR